MRTSAHLHVLPSYPAHSKELVKGHHARSHRGSEGLPVSPLPHEQEPPLHHACLWQPLG